MFSCVSILFLPPITFLFTTCSMGEMDGTHLEGKKPLWLHHHFWSTGAFIYRFFFMLSLPNCCRERVMMDFTFSYPHTFLSSAILQLLRSVALSGNFVDFTVASVKRYICKLPASESIVKILVVILHDLNYIKFEETGWPKHCSDSHSMQSQFLPSLLLMKVNGFPQEVNEDKFGFLGLKIPCFHGYLIMYSLNLIQLQQTESVHEVG